jgi:S1-C subfamily serine protease
MIVDVTGRFSMTISLVFSLVLYARSVVAEDTLAQKLLDAVRPAVPIVTAIDTNSKAQRQGTGLIVDGNLVLTNKHVVANANMLIVHFQDLPTEIFQGALIARHPKRDLAALRLNKVAAGRPAVEFATTDVKPGTQVVVTGNSTIEGPSNYRRLVLSEEDNLLANGQFGQPDDRVYIINQIPALPGLSGAPVFDFQKKCVGLMTGARIVRLADLDGLEAAEIARPFCIDALDVKHFVDNLTTPEFTPGARDAGSTPSGRGIVPLSSPARASEGVTTFGATEARAEWESLSTLRVAEVEEGARVGLNNQIASILFREDEGRFPGGGLVSNSLAHYSMLVPAGWSLREEFDPIANVFQSIYTKDGFGEVRVVSHGIHYPWLYRTADGQVGNDPAEMLQINVINHRRNSLRLWLDDHNRTDRRISRDGRTAVRLGRLHSGVNGRRFGDAYTNGDSVFRYRHYEAVDGAGSWFCLCVIKWNVFVAVDFRFEKTALQPNGAGRAKFTEMLFFPLSLSTTE